MTEFLFGSINQPFSDPVFFSIDSAMIYIWEVEEIGLILRGFKQLTK